MHQAIDFDTQADLESFLFKLKTLMLDSSFLILDQSKQRFVYEFNDKKINNSLFQTLKKTIQHHELEIGRHMMSDAAQSIELFCHRHPIRIIDQHFEGTLYLLQSTQVIQKIKQDQNITTLEQTFHSHSPEMQRMFSIIQRVAVTEFPVLVRGESGSGKELVAQAIHDHSQRKNNVFIAINCAALNANILESELFGHVKGAFTGAIREHKGVFERAAGGTLFLDEIAEIPLELQAKLLRVLETGEFTPLGGEKSIRANVRIITATHRALREEARLGRFRQDLLYRLRVIPIFVPPLRDRKQDIPYIADYILSEQHNVFGTSTKLSNSALQTLMQYDWPGNVRELKNTLLYALTMANEKSEIDVCDLPDEIIDKQHIPPSNSLIEDEPLLISDKINKETIRKTLIQYQNDLSLAAKALNISRTTLWRYRKKFNL